MPPKKIVAKPKPVARRGAAATTAASTTDAPETPAPTENPDANFRAPVANMMAPVAAMMDIDTPEPTLPTAPSQQETPAVKPEPVESKPIAPPKGRLDSLTTPRGQPGIRGAASASKLKFKPKVVARKSKEEREELDAKFKAEQDAAEKNAESTRGRGGARGGRGGRGRGRGGMRGGAAELQMGASGPFALGSIVTAGRQKVMAERGLNTGRNQRSFNFKSKIKAENRDESTPAGQEYSSSDESDGEERMDVEYISLLDDSADEDGDFKMTPEWGSGAPIRIPRSEHLDRQVLVNTDSSSKKSKSELKALKEKEMTFETEIKIKDEPVEEEEGFIPSSPELSRRKVKVSASPERRRKQAPGEFDSPRKPRSAKKKVVSTTEEKEEYERIDVDKKLAFYELAGAMEELDIKPLAAKGEDADGDIDMNADAPTNAESAGTTTVTRNPETENQIFFFQFPPLLPHLVTETEATKAEPKTEDPEVKTEAPMAPPKKNALKGKALLKAQMALLTGPPPAGMVGKMRVHKSGRISMLWGNPDENGEGVTEMEVNRGAHCEFLQEVVVIKEESPYGEADVDEKGRPKGAAYSLGQVKGKYVVSPDFLNLITASNGKKSKGKGKEKEKKVEITTIDE